MDFDGASISGYAGAVFFARIGILSMQEVWRILILRNVKDNDRVNAARIKNAKNVIC